MFAWQKEWLCYLILIMMSQKLHIFLDLLCHWKHQNLSCLMRIRQSKSTNKMHLIFDNLETYASNMTLMHGCRSLPKCGGAWGNLGVPIPPRNANFRVLLHFSVTMYWKLGMPVHPRNKGCGTPALMTPFNFFAIRCHSSSFFKAWNLVIEHIYTCPRCESQLTIKMQTRLTRGQSSTVISKSDAILQNFYDFLDHFRKIILVGSFHFRKIHLRYHSWRNIWNIFYLMKNVLFIN